MEPQKQSWLLAGGLLTALAASVCCVGPVIALALGATGFAASSRFSAGRPYFLAAAFLLLAGAWYLTYRRPRRECSEGEACAPNTSRRLPKIALWIITAIAVPAALLPLLPSGSVATNGAPLAGGTEVRLRIPTMDCAACAKNIQAALMRQPGVQRAQVDYDSKNAVIGYDVKTTSAAQIVATIDGTGFKAEPVSTR